MASSNPAPPPESAPSFGEPEGLGVDLRSPTGPRADTLPVDPAPAPAEPTLIPRPLDPDCELHQASGRSPLFGLDMNELLGTVGLGYGQALIFLIGGLAWTFDAIEVTIIAFLIPLLRCIFGLSNFLSSVLASAVYLGMGLGSVLWSWLADRYGRRPALFGTILVTFVFGLGSAFAPEPLTFVLLRGGLGVGIGGTIPLAAGTFLEYCPVNLRGFWATVLTGWWAIGSLFGVGIVWLTLGVSPSDETPWRVLLVLGTLPGLVLLPLLVGMHDTPQYLALSGRHDRLLYVLCTLARRNGRLEAFHNALLSQVIPDAPPSLTEATPLGQARGGDLGAEEGGGFLAGVCGPSGPHFQSGLSGQVTASTLEGIGEAPTLGDSSIKRPELALLDRSPEPNMPQGPDAVPQVRLWARESKVIDLDLVVKRLVELWTSSRTGTSPDFAEHPEPDRTHIRGQTSGSSADEDEPAHVARRRSLIRVWLSRIGGVVLPRSLQRFAPLLDPVWIIPISSGPTSAPLGPTSASLGPTSDSSDPTSASSEPAWDPLVPVLVPSSLAPASPGVDASNPTVRDTLLGTGSSKLFRQETRTATQRGRLRSLFSPQLRGLTFRLIVYVVLFSFAYYAYELALPVILGNTPNTCPVHFSTQDYLGLAITVLISLPFVVLAAYIAEIPRLGRRGGSVIFMTLSGLSLVLLGIFLLVRPSNPTGILGFWVLVVLTSLVNGLINGSSGIIQIYMTEAYPTVVRGIGIGFVSLFNRLASVVAPLVLGLFLDFGLTGVLILMFGASFAIILYVIITLPFETANRNLKGVSEELTSS